MTAVAVYGGDSRVGFALGLSVALHMAAVVGLVVVLEKASREKTTVISDVQLLVEEAQKAPERRRKRRVRKRLAKPPSMKDFFKLAMPSVKPRPKGPLKLAAPKLQERKLMQLQPKLNDRGKMRQPMKMKALDMGRKRLAAKSVTPLAPAARSERSLMALPKLEEVGTRQAAPKVLQMAKLAEERSERLEPQGLGKLGPQLERRRAPRMAAPLLDEAAPAREESALSRLASSLPTGQPALQLEPKRESVARKFESLDSVKAPSLPPRRETSAIRKVAKKKAVEIEGEIKNRKVRDSSLPRFPEWLKDLGVFEAEVRIKFYVSASGFVKADRMHVSESSSYGRLDRLCMEHLKKWRFDPLPLGASDQWGIITFIFVSE